MPIEFLKLYIHSSSYAFHVDLGRLSQYKGALRQAMRQPAMIFAHVGAREEKGPALGGSQDSQSRWLFALPSASMSASTYTSMLASILQISRYPEKVS